LGAGGDIGVGGDEKETLHKFIVFGT